MIIDTSADFQIDNIKCCVHTLQLAVKDAVTKSAETTKFLTSMNKVAVALRTGKSRNLLKDWGCPTTFVLDGKTR